MNITGTVKVVEEVKVFSDKFKKKEIVVTTEEKYPQDILIGFVNDKIKDASSVKVGDKVSVDVNLRGREWVSPQGESKYFVSLDGWSLSQMPKDDHHKEPESAIEDDLPF